MTIARWWNQYWFADGGRWAAAIVRIAIATSVLLSLCRLQTRAAIPGPASLYRPVGVWMAFGDWVPPPAVIDALWLAAWAATLAMLLGLATRIATVLSFAAAVALVSASYASSAAWSHQYNVVFLAQLAFVGARGGDALSLDRLIRRLRGLPPIEAPRGYQWSLRLVQLAVVLMFAGAAFHKLRSGGFGLRWALSDNLRHQLLVHYDLADLPRPELVDWLLAEPWRYRTAALLNIVTQATPVMACIYPDRPVVRAIGGACFAIETLALGLIVGLWNLHWLPLAAVFIDWDRLFARVSAGRPPTVDPARSIQLFVIAFFTFEALTSFVPKIDQRLNTYPFSSFPMFASVRASAPYNEHRTYAVPGDRYDVAADRPLDAAQQRWFDYQHRRLYRERDPARVSRKLAALLDDARARWPDLAIRAIRHYVAIYEAPPYPAPAHFERHPLAILAELRDGTFRCALGRLDGATLVLAPRGLTLRDPTFVWFADHDPTPHPLAAAPLGAGRFAITPLPEASYIAVVIDGERWLVTGDDG